MHSIKILLFLSISSHAYSNGCKSFISDANKVNDSAGISEEEVPLICGIREGHIVLQTNTAHEYINHDLIKWNEEAKCVDDHTIFLTVSTRKHERKTYQNVDFQTYLAILCVGHAQIDVIYDGILPATGNILTSRFLDNQRYFTALYIPYETTKSGNYTFQLTNLQSSRWFYVIFDSNSSDFWKPRESDLDVDSYEDPYDSRMIIIPCQISKPRIVNVALTHPSLNWVSKFVKYRPYQGHQIFYWDTFLYNYEATKGIVVPKQQLLQFVNSTLPQRGFATADNYVNCVNLNEPYSKRMIRINFNKKETTNDLHYSSRFKLEFFNQTFSCRSNYSGIYVGNVYFTSSSEWRFLSKCALKNNTCPWNSYYSDMGTVINRRDEMNNKKMNYCNSNFCSVAGIFKSGMVRCSTDNEREYVELLYFTGLDNKTYTFPPAKDLPADALVSVSPINTTDSKIYANESTRLSCKLVYYAMLPTFQWNVVLNNGTVKSLDYASLSGDPVFLTIIRDEDNNIGIAENKVEAIIPVNARAVLCRSLIRDMDSKYVESRLPIYVKYLPEIVKQPVPSSFKEANLSCWVRGEPTPTVKWFYNEKEIPTTSSVWELDETKFNVVTVSVYWGSLPSGNYTCVATNSVGEDYLIVLHEKDDGQPFNNTIWTFLSEVGIFFWLALGFLLFALIIIVTMFLMRRKNKATILTKEDISNFLNGRNQTVQETKDYACQPYNKDTEVAPKDFSIDTEDLLGSGAFGMVLKAVVRGEEAAAKTLKSNTHRSVLIILLDEIKIMNFLEKHPNIVSFIGAYTANFAIGEVYLFVEFCQMGSLEKHLRETKSLLVDSDPSTSIQNENRLIKNLISWAVQTANGMKYLAECKVIHGDLAVRNLLLKDIGTIKITDFGLAKQLNNYATYIKTQNQLLPWRHMSPESLARMEFSVKSDVWAFGVTLWEMFSLGDIPYSGLQWTVGFVASLESDLRLGKPKLCPIQVFKIAETCWNLSPQRRPDFQELHGVLQTIYLNIHNSDYLQVV